MFHVCVICTVGDTKPKSNPEMFVKIYQKWKIHPEPISEIACCGLAVIQKHKSTGELLKNV